MKEGDDGSAGSLRTDICRDAAGDRGGDRGRTWGDFTLVPDPAVPIHRPTTATYLGKGKVTFLAGGTEARRHFSNDCGKTWEYLVTPHPSKGWTAAGEGNQLVDWDANGMAARIAEFGSNRWLVEKGPKDDSPSDADRLALIVSRAGPQGINRKELGRCLDLDGPLLDQLLRALVGVGQLTASEENGVTVYRAVSWVRDLAGHARKEEKKIRSRG